MTEYCKHHPTKPAHWTCSKCRNGFCSGCILKRDKGEYYKKEMIYLCPKCVFPADWIAASNAISPFWDILPKFFAYPFRSPHSIILMFVLSLIGMFFTGPGLINILVRLAIGGVLIKYSFAALRVTARGQLSPPNVDAKTLTEDFQEAFVQIVFVAVIAICTVFIMLKLGVFLGSVFLIFALLSLPAIIMSYLATTSVISALNPMIFVKMIYRIGWAYLLMYFFLILLYSAPISLVYVLFKILPAGLAFFFLSLANCYYTIIFYHLMGYVLLQFHSEIGYKIDPEDFYDPSEIVKEKEEKASEGSPIIAELNFLAKEGKHDEAIAKIEKETGNDVITDIRLSEHYYKLLKLKKQIPAQLKHAVPHLKLLVKENRKDEACEAFLECLENDKEFLTDSQTMLKLGIWLNEAGKPKEAIKAFNRIIKGSPHDQLVPMAYFRAATIIHDKLENKARAEKILDTLQKKYPKHDIIPQVDNYLKRIVGG